jgi:putative ABC transport system substrate-binding protein
MTALYETARTLKVELVVEGVSAPETFKAAVDSLVAANIDAIQVTADPMFNNHKLKFIPIITEIKKPAIHQWREQVQLGGLMSFGPDIREAYNVAGRYTTLILNGQRPQDIPVATPTTVSFMYNSDEAKRLGLTIDPKTLLRESTATSKK